MIRDLAKEDDLSFIYSTWTNQINQSKIPYSPHTPRYLYVKACRRGIERVISTNAKVKLACDEEATSVLHGYAVYEDSLYNESESVINGIPLKDRKVLHFIYVKSPFRKLGLGKKLLESAGIDINKLVFTCWTDETESLWRKSPGALYVPLGLFDR